jgi:hypothetical protein
LPQVRFELSLSVEETRNGPVELAEDLVNVRVGCDLK